MRNVNVYVYTFNELSDPAKEVAIKWFCKKKYSKIPSYPWCEESLKSITTFCDYFHISLRRWSFSGAEMSRYYKTNATEDNFKGLSIDWLNRDYMPTGFELDRILWQTFYDEFKKTGNATHAFHEAMDSAFSKVRKDVKYPKSDEGISKLIMQKGYEFFKSGKRAKFKKKIAIDIF